LLGATPQQIAYRTPILDIEVKQLCPAKVSRGDTPLQ
jgi:hypothetical protein